MAQEKRPVVFIDDDKLADDIRKKLAKAGVELETHVIRTIMQYQTNNYENLGIIKIVYRKP